MQGATTNRSDIVEQISQETGLPHKHAELMFLSIMGHIKTALLKGETVKINGFGVFSVVERKETVGRNVKAGHTVKIPSRKVVVFKPSEKIKKRVDSSLR